MRYEIAIDAEFELRPRRRDWRLADPLEPVATWFQKRRFVWHPGKAEYCPIVTTPYEGDDFTQESEATERFLSALSRTETWGLYTTTVGIGTGHGSPQDEFATPTWKQPRRYGGLIHHVLQNSWWLKMIRILCSVSRCCEKAVTPTASLWPSCRIGR